MCVCACVCAAASVYIYVCVHVWNIDNGKATNMKIVSQVISNKDGEGYVCLRAEEGEDMWHAYNLIMVGDLIKTVTMRKVIQEGNTGSISSKKVKINLKIDVKKVDFDPQECTIRISGQNKEENKYVKIGQYHTLELALHRNFTLHKLCWDTVFLERLTEATDIKQQADLAAVIMQQGQQAMARVCLVTGHMTVVRAKIEQSIPRKRSGRSGHGKAVERFYENILQSILRHVQFAPHDHHNNNNTPQKGNSSRGQKKPKSGSKMSMKSHSSGGYDGDQKKKSSGKVKCLVIASPGYTRNEFYNWLLAQCSKRDLKEISEHKSQIILAHSSSGHKHALNEVFMDEAIQQKISETKAASEVKMLKKFFHTLSEDPARAYYSYPHCLRACELGAIEVLLVSDSLFRSCKLEERKKYVALVENTRDAGGIVKIFSAQHLSGQQLEQVSGVAAILRYPVPEIEDEVDMSSSSDDSSSDDEYSNNNNNNNGGDDMMMMMGGV